VILINHDRANAIEVARGDRIAQLVVHQVAHVLVDEVAELPGSHRGVGGFGSTGGHAGTVSS
jgi:dUTP pyrophosphatase